MEDNIALKFANQSELVWKGLEFSSLLILHEKSVPLPCTIRILTDIGF